MQPDAAPYRLGMSNANGKPLTPIRMPIDHPERVTMVNNSQPERIACEEAIYVSYERAFGRARRSTR